MNTRTQIFLLLSAAIPLTGLTQPNFTKTTIGGGDFEAGEAWVDYDGDGNLDLVVANGVATSGETNAIYRNNGNGTLTQITSGVVVTDVGNSLSVAAGDYDNDGLPDLFFGGVFGSIPSVLSLLYHNTGNGNFERITEGDLVNTYGNFIAVWGDYDNDGFLDIFLANTGGTNFLFHNNRDGTFSPITVAMSLPQPTGGKVANGAAWADYDNDGYLDMVLTGGNNSLFHNNRDGTFTRVSGTPFDTDAGPSTEAVWGDYDNDGFLDLFVVNGNFDELQHHNYLYHNNGNGTFTKVLTEPFASDGGSFVVAAWEDFDNDGNLDLFVTRSTGFGTLQNNALYHNNGDGSFTSVTNSALVADSGHFGGIAWGDYDNDGFPDVFVAAGQPSFLFHNQGNGNTWITFKLVGTVSNRSAIGAKVRVKATIHGKTYWQLREIDSLPGSNPNPHFGLGDATNAEIVRIEWPSGSVQEFHDIAARQFLTVTEPSRLVSASTNGTPRFILRGGRNMKYDIQTSANLAAWSPLFSVTITNLDGTAQIMDTNSPGTGPRFYRAMLH
jgi:hypothetical protein